GKPDVPNVTPTDLCIGQPSVYFATATGASSFTWVPSGQIYGTELCLNGSCSQFYIEWDWYFAYMEVFAENSCGTSDPFNSWNYCRINGNALDAQVYPNPTDGKATVEFSVTNATEYSINVTDLAGREVVSKEVAAERGLNQVEIDLSSVGKGLYLVNIKGQDGTNVVKRLAVE
ncbi:MAG TPA: T9SS type A sorting domain-containing protein, partial [Bacteroidia bacterium]|nr:T9SS type A sorting domain-containing protein [Bacteroidia bacterium]